MAYVSKFSILGRLINVKDAEARQSINDLYNVKQNKLSDCVWLGDSFTTGFQSNGTYLPYTIPRIVSDKLRLTMHHYGVNASGYVTIGDAGSTFMTQAINAVNDDTLVNDNVKYVFILGGLNDYNNTDVTSSALNSASVALVNYLMVNFSNAQVVAIPNWASFDMGANVEKMLSIGNIDVGNYNRRYLFLRDNLLSLQGYSDYINPDNVHPNQMGATQMAECIYSLLNGVTPNLHRTFTVTANPKWDTSNFSIIEDFYGYHFTGSVQATDTILAGETIMGALSKHITFYGDVFDIMPSKSATSVCSTRIYPSIDNTAEGIPGYIAMYNDLGNTMNAGDNILIDKYVYKNKYLK